MKALNGNVILEPIEAGDMTEGGLLYVPDNAKEKTYRGTVVDISRHEWNDFKAQNIYTGKSELPNDVSVGDIVFYDKYDAKEIKDGDRKLVVVNKRKLLAVTEKSDD